MRFFNFAYPAMLILISAPSMAHVPMIEKSDSSGERPFRITTALEKSIAVYASLHGSDNVDVYQFTVTNEDIDNRASKIHIGSLTPRCTDYRLFVPKVYLIGPEQSVLPYSPEELLRGIWIPAGANHGAVEVPRAPYVDRDETSFYEKFAGTWYWWDHKADFTVDKPGTYWVVVHRDSQVYGDYVLEFGDKEQWTAADIGRSLFVLPRLRRHGEISSDRCRTELRRAGRPGAQTAGGEQQPGM